MKDVDNACTTVECEAHVKTLFKEPPTARPLLCRLYIPLHMLVFTSSAIVITSIRGRTDMRESNTLTSLRVSLQVAMCLRFMCSLKHVARAHA